MSIYAIALSHYGSSSQINQCIEECAELIVALNQYRRGRVTTADVIQEISDVLIMAGQMRMLFGAADVDEAVRRKLDRLKKRIEGKNS